MVDKKIGISRFDGPIVAAADFLFELLKRALVLVTVSYAAQKTHMWQLTALWVVSALLLGGWIVVKTDPIVEAFFEFSKPRNMEVGPRLLIVLRFGATMFALALSVGLLTLTQLVAMSVTKAP